MAENATVSAIRELSPSKPGSVIVVRVVSKAPVREWSNVRSAGRLFSVGLVDAFGDEIRAAAFNDAVDLLFPLLEVGKCYCISDFIVKDVNRKFSKFKDEHEIVLTVGTAVKQVRDDKTIPEASYNFTPIDEICSRAVDETIDVIGVVMGVSEPTPFTTKSGSETSRRSVLLVDRTSHSIELYVWAELAVNLTVKKGDVLALRGCKVSCFNGRSLSSAASTVIRVDPEVPEADMLRQWFASQAGSLRAVPTTVPAAAASSPLPPLFTSLEDIPPMSPVSYPKLAQAPSKPALSTSPQSSTATAAVAVTAATATAATARRSPSQPPCLLVIVGSNENWYELCDGVEVSVPGVANPVALRVEQAAWDEMSLTSYSDSGAMVLLGPASRPVDVRQKAARSCKPDLVLVRNFCRSVGGRLHRRGDLRNLLLGFCHAGVPTVNSWPSLLAEFERPIVYGALAQVARKYGKATFPLIDQNYYPDHSEIVVVPQYPVVLKVGFPHAGFGKVKVENSEDLEDVASLVALHHDYATAESFVSDVAYELRIVRIAGSRGAPTYYRAHKRVGMGWKVNTGASEREDVEMCERWKFWADRASECLGGLELLALDAIVDSSGHETILEVNGSEMGLAPEHERDELEAIRHLVVSRLEDELVKRAAESGVDAAHRSAPMALVEPVEVEVINLRNDCAQMRRELEGAQEQVGALRVYRAQHKKSQWCWSVLVSFMVAQQAVIVFLALHFFGEHAETEAGLQ
eukprot:m51a1_g12256 putative synapsin short isoform (746) ;mRNA; f:169341-171976